MKRSYRQAGSDFIINSVLCTAALGAGTALIADDTSLPPYVAGGILCGALMGLYKQNASTSRTTPNWASFASNVKLLAADTQAGEFVFAGLGLPTNVPLSQLQRFAGVAKRRQMKARYGFKEIKSKDVLSQVYFTKRMQPPFMVVEYRACLIVCGYTRRLVERRKGHAGRLLGIDEMTSTEWTETVRSDWLRLLGKSDKRTKFNLFGTRLGSMRLAEVR